MTCHQVHLALRGAAAAAGQRSSLEEAAAHHFDGCAACRALAADGALLAQALGEALEPAPHTERDSDLFTRITAEVAADGTVLGGARARPTAQRVAVPGAALVAICAAVLVVLPRVDLSLFPPGRMLLSIAIYLGAGAWLATATLRSIASRRRLSDATVLGLGLIAGPLLLALLPAAHRAHPASLMGVGDMLWAKALPCLMFGMAASVPLVAILWVLERSGQSGRGRALLGATAAGLGGSLALHLECAITLPPHLLVAHAPVPLLVALLWLAVHAGIRRVARSADA